MPLKLSRKVTRKVKGDLVVTIEADGIALRKLHGRRKVLVPWAKLELAYLHIAKSGKEAFLQPLPPRWLPNPGDWVWVWSKPSKRPRRARVLKILHGVGEEILRLRGRMGRDGKHTVFDDLLRYTRPCQSGGDVEDEKG